MWIKYCPKIGVAPGDPAASGRGAKYVGATQRRDQIGSDVDRAAVDGEGRFLDCFAQCRMGVAGARDILR